jgi:hypothetical protein
MAAMSARTPGSFPVGGHPGQVGCALQVPRDHQPCESDTLGRSRTSVAELLRYKRREKRQPFGLDRPVV